MNVTVQRATKKLGLETVPGAKVNIINKPFVTET